jgi:predicted permease
VSVTDALSLFYASLAVSLPTFAWVVVGIVAPRLGVFPEALNQKVSRLAFNYGLPVMLLAARGDGTLAANIVVLTTLQSIVTITVGFFLLSLFSLVG